MQFALWVDLILVRILDLFILPFLFGKGQVILPALEQLLQMRADTASENVVCGVLGFFACAWCS